MNAEPTDIPGVLLVRFDIYKDERGTFAETYDRKKFAAIGIDTRFVQDSISTSAAKGTVRGLHFQRAPRAQAKLVRASKGRLFDVALDVRPESETFGRYATATLSEGDGTALFIPEGFAHGFCTLEADTEIAYKMSDHFSPEHYMGVAWNDPALGIDWPVAAKAAVLSARDRLLPTLADVAKLLSKSPRR